MMRSLLGPLLMLVGVCAIALAFDAKRITADGQAERSCYKKSNCEKGECCQIVKFRVNDTTFLDTAICQPMNQINSSCLAHSEQPRDFCGCADGLTCYVTKKYGNRCLTTFKKKTTAKPKTTAKANKTTAKPKTTKKQKK